MRNLQIIVKIEANEDFYKEKWEDFKQLMTTLEDEKEVHEGITNIKVEFMEGGEV